jgi:hypothetical protein
MAKARINRPKTGTSISYRVKSGSQTTTRTFRSDKKPKTTVSNRKTGKTYSY